MKSLETVTASEIGDFVYCSESWRLGQVGHESANQAVRDTGTVHHTGKAVAERVAGGSIAVGRILILTALLSLAALWWFSQ